MNTPNRIPYDVWLKLHSRRMYFLSEEHIVLLKGEELNWYIRKVWYWLVFSQHVGPLWLTSVVRTLYCAEGHSLSPMDELPPDLGLIAQTLSERMKLTSTYAVTKQ